MRFRGICSSGPQISYLLAAGQLLEIIFTFFTLNVLCEAEEEPMLPEDEEPLEAELPLGLVLVLALPLGLVLELPLGLELALSPAPLPSEPLIRT
jgi:hypothetical protein